MPETTLQYGAARVRVVPARQELGAASAAQAARILEKAIREKGKARVIIATGNSQLDMITALVEIPDIDWKSVEVFHMDEYAGMAATHPASFRLWIKKRVEDKVHPGKVNYIAGDASDPEAEIERYTQLLMSEPIDLAFVGFGENGHIAFNDPHVADFNDPKILKRVTLDDPCRRQQAGEGHFPTFDDVPKEAFTVTCPGLFRAEAWVCCVPEARKAEAVRGALEGPIATSCPSSIVRTHPNATVYLDKDSAALLGSKP